MDVELVEPQVVMSSQIVDKRLIEAREGNCFWFP